VPVEGCGRYCGYPKNSLSTSKSSTYATDNTSFSIRYGEGFARGIFAQDTMTVNGVSVPQVVRASCQLQPADDLAKGFFLIELCRIRL
jgi:hypothetical protein